MPQLLRYEIWIHLASTLVPSFLKENYVIISKKFHKLVGAIQSFEHALLYKQLVVISRLPITNRTVAMSLSQSEFEFLLGIPKIFKHSETIILGPPPLNWTRDLFSPDTRDIFLLDFHRGSIELRKYTINKRYHQTVCLVRLDTQGRHTNPDGELIDGPHVHLYREDYDDKFAYPINVIGLSSIDLIENSFLVFLRYCNVINLPTVQFSAF